MHKNCLLLHFDWTILSLKHEFMDLLLWTTAYERLWRCVIVVRVPIGTPFLPKVVKNHLKFLRHISRAKFCC